MTKVDSGRPLESEHAPDYAGYIGKIESTDIIAVLERQLDSTLKLLRGIDETTGNFRYEPGKWSVKELIGHIIDGERVFAYRALVFSRNDSTALPGFDQDKWAAQTNYARLPLAQIVSEFEAVRRATLFMFRQFDAETWNRTGTANDQRMSTRAAAYVIAGHLQHHLEVLQTRYLK